MANVCEICGKKTISGYSVSHSHVRTKRTWKPNIQKVRTRNDKGTPVTVNVCTSCLKANKVIKAY
ncbi:MAG TPA: 50S ribosomal protein L28 [Armatimonadota bacterium]|nr:50S ribosomal protein L28 [Armatimonadota bacterium]